MLFLNTWLLLGLLAVAIPVIIHLLNRRSARFMEWGAMLFLQDSFTSRKSRIHLEDVLLMITRCMLLVLLGLAMARPFIPAGSVFTWIFVLPLVLGGFGCLAAWSVLRDEPGLRRKLMVWGSGALMLASALIVAEMVMGRRYGGAERDVVIVLDTSSSMGIKREGKTNFEYALDEAKTIIRDAQPGVAFGIVLAGGVTEALFPAPIASRQDVIQRLDKLEPGAGSLNIPQAIEAAVECLASGSHGPKQILIISDGQAQNWNATDMTSWGTIREIVKRLPTKPQIIWRRLPFPGNYRNVAIERISFPKSSTGVYQDTAVDVVIRNTGTEAVTPTAVTLKIGDKSQLMPAGGQLAPGVSTTVRFHHRFEMPGVQPVTARLIVDDDLRSDNTATVVIPVAKSLHVLVVDGNPAPSLLDRAAGFAALALTPDEASTMVPQVEMSKTRYVMKTTVIDAPNITKIDNFASYHAVVLADVVRLPSQVVSRLTHYVENGGGLLIAPGERVQPDFYNGWTVGGAPFMPARLSQWHDLRAPEKRQPALDSFRMEALKGMMDTRISDLDTWVLNRYWELHETRGADVTVGARLDDGEPLLAERRLRQGRILLTAFPFEASSGNLVSRQAYVPFLHNLVYALAEPASPDLNLEAAPSVTLSFAASLAGNPQALKTQGLRGEYFVKAMTQARADLVRIDPAVDLTWTNMPIKVADNKKSKWERPSISIRWTGSLTPRKTGTHMFSCEGGRLSALWIDGNQIFRSARARRKEVALTAGKAVDIRYEYVGGANDYVRLLWTEPGSTESVVPSACLLPTRGDAAIAEMSEQLTIVDPSGKEREISAEMRNGLVELTVSSRPMPGLYRVKATYTLRNVLGELTDAEGNLPFTISTGIAESTIESLPGPALVLIRQFVDLMEAASPREMLLALSGKRFGQELWRMLTWGALILVVLEIGLARWIAGNRRSGQWKRVAFDDAAAAAQVLERKQ